MKQTTRIAIAALLHSAGKVLSALAAEFGNVPSGDGDDKPQETPATPEEEKPKRGRKAAAAQPETPAETVAPAEPVVTKSYEDMKQVIKPFVEGGRGLEVKATIAKFAPTLREMDPKDYAAFEAAMAALPAEKPEEY